MTPAPTKKTKPANKAPASDDDDEVDEDDEDGKEADKDKKDVPKKKDDGKEEKKTGASADDDDSESGSDEEDQLHQLVKGIRWHKKNHGAFDALLNLRESACFIDTPRVRIFFFFSNFIPNVTSECGA